MMHRERRGRGGWGSKSQNQRVRSPALPRREWSAAVFALAAATDWLDGFLARRLSLETPFGAFFDPVADKLMVRASRGAAAAAGARRGRRRCAALTPPPRRSRRR